MGQQVNEFLWDESDWSDKSDRGFFGDSKIRYLDISIFRKFGCALVCWLSFFLLPL